MHAVRSDFHRSFAQTAVHYGVVGASVHIFDGAEEWSEAVGVGSDGRPIDPATRLPTGSTAKLATAYLVARQVETGAAGLDEPITDRLPALRRVFSHDVPTLRHLLAHASGLPDLFAPIATIDELIDKIADAGLLAPAGALFSYSNTAYVLLGLWLEQISGRSWRELVAREFTDLHGLESVVAKAAEDPDWAQAGHALAADGRRTAAAPWPATSPLFDAAGASLWSNARDLARLVALCATGRDPAHPTAPPRLSDAVLTDMQQAAVRVPGIGLTATHWGLGWGIDAAPGRAPILKHMGGTSALVMVDRSQNRTVAVLTNDPMGARLGEDFSRFALGVPQRHLVPCKISPLERSAGLYGSPTFKLNVNAEGDGLSVDNPLMGGRVPLQPAARGAYWADFGPLLTEATFLGRLASGAPRYLHLGLRALPRSEH
jgi:CubicO group peptidase (beta-lactamase class C family)